MTVKIKIAQGRQTGEQTGRPNAAVELAAHLLSPAALVAVAVGLWALGCELQLAHSFAISEGAFAHWQAWMVLGAAMQTAAAMLQRHFQSKESATPYATPNSERTSSRIRSR